MYPYEEGEIGDMREDLATWEFAEYVEICKDQSNKTVIKKDAPATVELGDPVDEVNEDAPEQTSEDEGVHVDGEGKAIEDAPNKSMKGKKKSNK